jgi:sialate O-acetylesterase
VPGRLVKAGANTLAIRVTNVSGEGGMTGRPAECRLELPGTDKGVALAGDWAYEVGLRFERKTMPTAPKPPAHPAAGGASGMYNAMIAPLAPYAIRGAIWYQGESNAGRAYAYRTLLPTMIGAWRKAFDNEFTFLIVQLANFLARTPQPGESAWAELREAQAMTAANTPKCGLAVTIDIGEANDIHPKNKQDVGRRLGLGAEAIAYGRQIVHSGPVYDSMKIEGDKVRLVFRHVGGGLDTRVGTSFAPATQPAPDGKLTGFAIAGEDRKFVWAEARIEGESVVVWSNAVPKPVAVRYAWADNPACNLYNKAGLPAVPFRTDDWSGVTIPKPTTATTRQGPGAGPMHQRWSNVRM